FGRKKEGNPQMNKKVASVLLVLLFCALFQLVNSGQFSKALSLAGISTGSSGGDSFIGIFTVYVLLALAGLAIFLLLEKRNPGVTPGDLLRAFKTGGSFYSRILPVCLGLFFFTYLLFYFVLSGSLPYPESPLYIIPVFFLIRFTIVLVEESVLKGFVQESFGRGPAALAASAILSGTYFGFSTKFLPLPLNVLLGTAIGAATSYLYLKSGGKAIEPIVARSVYETLLLMVLV
ncbi:MAG: CPBP family glutamic-type intramembrane protease, partial [archaeon]